MLLPVALPVLLGGVAVYLLLPRPRNLPPIWGAALSGAALLAAGSLLVWGKAVTPERLLFYAFSGIAIAFGALLVTQRNPVHAALSFALVVLSTCGLFLLQAAPFLMAATVIIYAGAIVVTFLFVIMLAQQEGLSDADHRSREPLLSTLAGFILLGALLYVLNRTYDTREMDALINRVTAASKAQSVEDAGEALGDEDVFFAEFEQLAAAIRGPSSAIALERRLRDVRVNWSDWKRNKNTVAVRQALSDLAELAIQVRDSIGMLYAPNQAEKDLSPFNLPVSDPNRPGETVAPLGRMLFTDYLVAVELAGLILLAATIGAIAIAGRRAEGLR
jgi:NADH:ubiquinone oxidoreductase subunit 6 (subunit J)